MLDKHTINEDISNPPILLSVCVGGEYTEMPMHNGVRALGVQNLLFLNPFPPSLETRSLTETGAH